MGPARALFQRQQEARWAVAGRGPGERRDQLRRLLAALLAARPRAQAALAADFRKAPEEVDLAELVPLAAELRLAIRQMERWMAPERVPAPLAFTGTRAWIRPEPKGWCWCSAPGTTPST